MTEEELARHDSKTLLQLLLSADARCDDLTAQLESTLKDRALILAERDRLRGALEGLLTLVEHANFEEGWCCCGDDMLHHQNPMDCGHTPVDMGEYHASLAIKEARAALKGDSHE